MPLTRDASVTQLFLELVAVPSPSRRERVVGELIREWLAAHGVPSAFDGAGVVNGSDAGNLIATVAGAPDAPVYLFVAHMDTVETGSPAVTPRVDDDGVIRSDGTTILGADNKAAVAAVMRVCAAAAALPEERRPTVHACFTCCEESGKMGAGLLAPELLAGVDCAFSVDGAKPVGTVITRALGQTSFAFVIHGRAAHAAANPEAGVNAIAVASAIVTALPLGRQPGGGSVNVAAIVGGSVIERLEALGNDGVEAALSTALTNSVPDRALVRGEVRGYSTEEIEETVATITDTIARVCDARGARYDWIRDRSRTVPPFPHAAESRARALVQTAAATVDGLRIVLEERQATLEANYLAASTDVVALASGSRDPHQVSESIPVSELDRLEDLLVAILLAHAEAIAAS
ncbi:MAG TPA: M20/M25/M40 family metallo-hydrolase [Solirubrobacteraceae bacterium]|nr:M20/M25/M40 family metallo-hydrolase [Solirubrobacteraceae bacterium]